MLRCEPGCLQTTCSDDVAQLRELLRQISIAVLLGKLLVWPFPLVSLAHLSKVFKPINYFREWCEPLPIERGVVVEIHKHLASSRVRPRRGKRDGPRLVGDLDIVVSDLVISKFH